MPQQSYQSEIEILRLKLAQKEAELSIISSVSEAISQQLDISAIIHIIGDKIRDIFKADITEILLLDEKTNMIHVPYSFYKSLQTYEPFTLGEGVTSKVINSGKPIVNRTLDESAKMGMIITSEEDKTETYIGIPIVIKGKVLGVVSIQSYKPNDVDDEKIRLLTILSVNIGSALENVRLFSETKSLLLETKQSALELGIINSVGEGLAKQLDYQSIIDLVGNKVREVFNAQILSISSYDEESDTIFHKYVVEKDQRFTYDHSIPIDLARRKIITTRSPLFFGTSQALLDEAGGDILDGEFPKSFMGVPIINNEKVIGVITVQDLDNENLYSENDANLLFTLASNMGVALENARLFDETKRLLKETEQRTAELAVINSVQEGLARALDMQSIYDLVGQKIRDLFDAQAVIIAAINHETATEHFKYHIEKGIISIPESRPYDKLRKHMIDTKQKIVIHKSSDEIRAQYGLKTIPGTETPKSMIFVPLIVNDQVTSYISLQNVDIEFAFSDSDVKLLETLTNSMSVALENARLFEETQRLLSMTEEKNAELGIINSIQNSLASKLDMQLIYDEVGNKIQEIFDAQVIDICLLDPSVNMLTSPYTIERGVRYHREKFELFGFRKYVIENKQHLLLNDQVIEAAKKYGNPVSLFGEVPKSDLFVPLIVRDEAIGVISVQNLDREHAFTESNVRLLKTISNALGLSLENARLFDETLRLLEESKKRAAELEIVNSISQAIAGHLEIDKLINLVGDKVRQLFNAGIVYLALLEKETDMIFFPYGYGDEYPPLKLGEGLTSNIIKTKKPLLINNEFERKAEELGGKIIGTKSSSYLGVPIPLGEEIIGVLSVQSTQQENLFNQDDMRLLGTIAAHVGIAINNANSYKKINSTLADLQATQTQLIHSEKMASLGELTAGIAHEIQNPLNFVNNFSEVNNELISELISEIEKKNFDEVKLLADDIKVNEEKINHHGRRADAIVKGMLQHSRSSTGTKEPTNINSLSDEYLRLAYHGLRAKDKTFNASFKTDFDDSIGLIQVISQDMGRVILNLITNAFYVVNERKKLSVGLNYEPTVSVSTRKFGNRVEIKVSDNGNGIPSHVLEKIFQPFFTTKPTGEGTGLGLSLSYEIVKAHGGELTVETKEGVGTTFTISLTA